MKTPMKADRLLTLLIWLAMAGLSLWAHFRLPDAPLPSHYGIGGEADAFMPRDQALALLPGLAAVILLVMWLIPAIMPKKVTPERFADVYGFIVVAVAVLMAAIHLMMILRALGLAVDPARGIMFVLGGFFIVIGNYLPKIRRNYLMGIRTPWTIADERVWEKTHRFAGPWFMLGGAVVIAAGFVPDHAVRVAVMIAALAVPALISVVYSYIISRHLGLT
ncbi:MAG: SdpI family protein [Asticcacaulis sp.]